MNGKDKLPSGRDENRVLRVISHYEHQSENEAEEEDEMTLERVRGEDGHEDDNIQAP